MDKIKSILTSIVIILLVNFTLLSLGAAQTSSTSAYALSQPGMLPDHPLYKVKVLRNKIVEKLIISDVKRLEYDLLHADKTIHASKILAEKGNIQLAKETALKGEHYYSMLVNDYNIIQLRSVKIPKELDKKILEAGIKHQEIFDQILKQVEKEDKETFFIAKDFSKRNYELLVGLQK